jgi:hypothetical protein
MCADDDRPGRTFSRRYFLSTIARFRSIAATALVAESSFSPILTVSKRPSRASQPVHVEISQAACGAYLRDDFSSGNINPAIWQTMLLDPGMRLEIDRGELCIRGTSAKIPYPELRANAGKLARYAGVTTRPIAPVDADVAVRVKVPSGIAPDPGAHVVCVHLCGIQPDCYSEVLFGKLESKPLEQWVREYMGARYRYRDARGWWFAISDQDPDPARWWRVSGGPLRELGDERVDFHDVLVTYDEPTRLSRGFLKIGERWVQLGEAERLVRGLSQVELKLTDPTPLFGTYREARFADFRFYPSPKRNPVRFVLKNKAAPYRGARLRVAFYTRDHTHRVSEAYTDGGIASLSVDTPAWLAFPVSATISIFRGEREIARGIVDARGIKGLYPGDAWELDWSQVSV